MIVIIILILIIIMIIRKFSLLTPWWRTGRVDIDLLVLHIATT